MELGVQLFGCTADFRKSPTEFLKSLAKIGYTLIEPCILISEMPDFPEMKGPIPFWSLDELDGFMQLARENGLKMSSAHIFGDLSGNIEAAKQIAARYGVRQFVIRPPKSASEEDMADFVSNAVPIADELANSGVELLLHNEASDISTKASEGCLLETALKRCNGKVFAQIDTGWVLYGGEDPLEFMNRNEKFVRSIHYKDLKKGYQDIKSQDIFACLGKGCLDARSIYEYGKMRSLPQIIDQDKSEGNMVEDLRYTAELLLSYENQSL